MNLRVQKRHAVKEEYGLTEKVHLKFQWLSQEKM